MKKIFSLGLVLLFFSGIPVFSASQESVKKAIITKCNELGVEPAIMLSIAKTESGFRQEARGASGSIGVFQLMPGTAKHLGINPYDLNDNIKGGILYYKSMYNILGSREQAVAAYNLGLRPVKNCRCVPRSAQPFVNRIMKDYQYYKTH